MWISFGHVRVCHLYSEDVHCHFFATSVMFITRALGIRVKQYTAYRVVYGRCCVRTVLFKVVFYVTMCHSLLYEAVSVWP